MPTLVGPDDLEEILKKYKIVASGATKPVMDEAKKIIVLLTKLQTEEGAAPKNYNEIRKTLASARTALLKFQADDKVETWSKTIGPTQEKNFNAALVGLNKKLLARSKETLDEEKPGAGAAVAAADAAEAAKRQAEKEAYQKKLKATEAEMEKLQKELDGLVKTTLTSVVVQKHPALNAAFTKFQESEFSTESMDFLNSSRPPFFSQATLPTDRNAATIEKMKRLVYEKFIPAAAPKPININSDTRNPLDALARAGNYLGMNFAAARKAIESMLGADSLARFKTKPEFDVALAAARQAVQKLIQYKEKERQSYENLVKEYT